ncbi:MAG TPA: cupin domain-containing protein [Gemmataceae bacterium]|nr:cupin domain-containing protein [Gemmataceae bacterium]
MAEPFTPSGEVVSVGPGGLTQTTTVIKAPSLKVVRLVIPAGKDIPEHAAPGDITVHCLAGAVEFTADGRTNRLTPGQLIYLTVGVRHALKGIEDAVVLVTAVSR